MGGIATRPHPASATTATVPHHRPVAEPAPVLLRALATILLVHGYLVGLWAARNETYLGLVDVLRRWVGRPFGLGEDFGPLGVMLLLAAIGYGTRPLARLRAGRHPREAGGDARGIRPLGTAVLATGLAGMLAAAGAGVWTVPGEVVLDPLVVLGNLLLVSHLVPGTPLLVPLAWVALIAACGALANAGTVRASPRVRWLWPTAQLLVAAALVLAGAAFEPLRSVAVHASFYPVLIAGQVVALARSRTLPGWAAGVLGALCWTVVAVAEPLLPPLTGWWYPVAAAYAVLLLAIAALFQGRTAALIAANPLVRWACGRVWWFVVLPGVIGFPVLHALDGWPLGPAVILAVAVTALSAEVSHRLLVLGARALGRPARGTRVTHRNRGADE